MVWKKGFGGLTLIAPIAMCFVTTAAASPQQGKQDPLDTMIIMRPINAFLANPNCETEDQLAQKSTGIPPSVSMHFPPVRAENGRLVPYHQACLVMKNAWKKNYPNFEAPKIPWPVQEMLIKQGAAIEWLMLNKEKAIK